VAWNAILISICAAARVPFTSLAIATVPLTAGLWVAALARAGAARLDAGSAAQPARESSPGRAALAFTLAAVLGAALYAARFGGPVYNVSDSPDHIGTMRRMLEHRELFPVDAFYRDPGVNGVDPRKFLWHGEAALVARIANVPPLQAWRDLPTLLSPLFVLNLAALGMLLAGGLGAALAAWALLLTYGGSLAAMPMRETVFATKLADQLALAAAVAVLADLTRPARGTRLAAFGLALAAVATHVFAALQFALVFGSLGIGFAIRDRGFSPALRRLSGTALGIAVATLPFVTWQVLRTPPALNPIHTEPQGLMSLWDGVRVVSPGVLWDWMGGAWLLFPLLARRLWREGRGNPAALYLLTTAAGVAAVLFFPPLVSLLQPRLGYLMMRVIWMMPLAGLIAWSLPRLIADLRAGAPRARRFAGVELALIAVLLAPAVLDAMRVASHAGEIAADERRHGPLVWRAELEWLDSRLPPRGVVLSDPVTSYSVPMMTHGYVVAMPDQHSSPSDSLALRRLLDARDALDPFADWARTREVVDRYGVDAVVLNRRFVEDPALDYWTPRREWFAEERARLDRAGPAFERILDHGDFVIYRVHRDALAALHAPPPPRPFVHREQGSASGVARRIAPGTPGLVALALSPTVAARGDTVRGLIVWRALELLPAGSYRVSVRFDRALPGGFEPPRFVAKPARKLVEQLRHERYRFRSDHLPVGGSYGVDLWAPGEVVQDSFPVVVPGDVAAGDYRVRVRMIRQPHYPNLRLSDYFFDDDYFSGLAAGWLRVADGPGGGGSGAGASNRNGGHRVRD